MPEGRAWMVMVRDLSKSVTIADQPAVVVCLVLDTGTGLVLGFGLDATRPEACRGAFERALAEAPDGAPFPPGPPARVLCRADDVTDVGAQLAAVIGARTPSPEEIIPGDEAEEIVDSLVGHLVGRSQPVDAAAPAELKSVFDAARTYAAAEPWKQPRSDDDLHLFVTIDGETTQYVPVVLGHDGIQRGLVLYPGTELPESLLTWEPDEDEMPPVPAGTVIGHLDPRDEALPDAVAKADRYGWPADMDLVPFFATITSDGPSDLNRRDALDLTTAMLAILDLDGRTELIPIADGAVEFTNGQQAEYLLESHAAAEALSDTLASADPQAVLRALLRVGGRDIFSPPSQRGPRRDDVVTYRVRVDLKGAKPPLWRRLELASDLMLDEVHEVLQAAFGWTGSHLHQFGAGPRGFYDFDTEQFVSAEATEEGEDGAPEAEVRLDEVLAEPGDRLFYMYDFGDGWEHVVKLEKVFSRDGDTPRAVCTKGRRPSPPEDCGGIGGYELAILANDPNSPEHQDALDRFHAVYGTDVDPADVGPIPFDIDEINGQLSTRFA
jgi:hypothetical protein